MGQVKVNNKPVVAPADHVTVAELKALAGVPANQRLYDRSGKTLEDDAVVPAQDAEYGVVTNWERG